MPSVSGFETKYFLETDDIYGAYKYRLEISKKPSNGETITPTAIVAKQSFASIRWSGADKPTDKRIVGSRLRVGLWGIDNVGGGHYQDLLEAKEREYLVEVYIRDGQDLTLYWKGFIVPDAYVQEIKDIPSSIDFYAADGLALTESDYLSDDNDMVDGVKIGDILDKYIENTGLEFDLVERMGYKKSGEAAYDNPIFDQLYVHSSTFLKDDDDIKESLSYKAIVESIIGSFNSRIVQSNGKLVIQSIMSATNNLAYDGGIYKEFSKPYGGSWSSVSDVAKDIVSVKTYLHNRGNSLVRILEPIAKEIELEYEARPVNMIYNGQVVVADAVGATSADGWDLNDPQATVSREYSASNGEFSLMLRNFTDELNNFTFDNALKDGLVNGAGNLIQGRTNYSSAIFRYENIGDSYVGQFKMKSLWQPISGIDDGRGIEVRYSIEHIAASDSAQSFYNFDNNRWTRETGSDPAYEYDNNGAHKNFRYKTFEFDQRGEWVEDVVIMTLPPDQGHINVRIHNPDWSSSGDNGVCDIFFDDFFLIVYPTSGNTNDYNPNVTKKVYTAVNEDASSDKIGESILCGTTAYASELTGKVRGQYWDAVNDDVLDKVSYFHGENDAPYNLEDLVIDGYINIYQENLLRYEATFIRNNVDTLSKVVGFDSLISIDYDNFQEERNLLLVDLEHDLKESTYNVRMAGINDLPQGDGQSAGINLYVENSLGESIVVEEVSIIVGSTVFTSPDQNVPIDDGITASFTPSIGSISSGDELSNGDTVLARASVRGDYSDSTILYIDQGSSSTLNPTPSISVLYRPQGDRTEFKMTFTVNNTADANSEFIVVGKAQLIPL